jgi:hypothetical protein
LFEEELKAITAVDIVDKENTFAFDEFEFKDNICEEKFVDFRTPEGGELGKISITDVARTHFTAY